MNLFNLGDFYPLKSFTEVTNTFNYSRTYEYKQDKSLYSRD
jgi:hypothetical protein